jgi:hypothetical protein
MTYTITDYDAITKQSVERKANANEIADIEALQEKRIARIAKAEADALARAALLARLGLTAEEAALLVG